MKADEKGIHLSRAEAWALLAFTGKGASHSVVHFRVGAGGKLAAASSDGKRSCYVEAKAEKGAKKGKWAVDREFLELAKLALKEPEHALIITPVGENKLPVASIVDPESGDVISISTWHSEAKEDLQLTLDQIHEGIPLPDDRNYRGSWYATDPETLKPLDRIRVAVDKQPITYYPPETDGQPLRFEVRAEEGRWMGSIVTEKVLGPGEERDEPEDEDEDAPGREDRQAALDLEETANGRRGG